MSIVELQHSIIKMVMSLPNEELVRLQLAILSKASEEEYIWWANLPPKKREGLLRSLAQADRGELIPHEEVMAEFAKWR